MLLRCWPEPWCAQVPFVLLTIKYFVGKQDFYWSRITDLLKISQKRALAWNTYYFSCARSITAHTQCCKHAANYLSAKATVDGAVTVQLQQCKMTRNMHFIDMFFNSSSQTLLQRGFPPDPSHWSCLSWSIFFITLMGRRQKRCLSLDRTWSIQLQNCLQWLVDVLKHQGQGERLPLLAKLASTGMKYQYKNIIWE